jgi:hypothetical protein
VTLLEGLFCIALAAQARQPSPANRPSAPANPGLDSLRKELRSRIPAADVALWSRLNEAILDDRLKALEEGQSQWSFFRPETVALLIALGGWAMTYQQLRLQQKQHNTEQRRAARSQLLGSLSYFSGKTQNRAVGVAIVEAHWKDWSDLRDTWVGVLVNQAVYLLTESDAKDNLAEHANLERIMWLLGREPERIRKPSDWELEDALNRAIDSCKPRSATSEKSTIGVYAERALLEKWQAQFKRLPNDEPPNGGPDVDETEETSA